MWFYYTENHIKKHGQVNEIVTYKIFVSFNSSRKPKILLFFAVADLDTIGHVIRQTRGQAFESPVLAF